MSNIIYTTKATCTGGRAGKAKLSDNPTELTLILPKELGGEGADKGLNPEQLFAIVYSSCFEGACAFVYKRDGFKFKPNSVSAEVSLLKREGGFSIAVNITAHYDKNVNQDEAIDLTNRAHIVCPYSYALQNNVEIKLFNTFE
jgi:osmotically inducible protein OsmC